MTARPAVLCKNYPFRKASPKAGEPGGSVPVADASSMWAVVRDCGSLREMLLEADHLDMPEVRS